MQAGPVSQRQPMCHHRYMGTRVLDQIEAKMIYCPLCGTANRRGSNYCNECGVKFDLSMQIKCSRCGALNPIADALCNECGEQLSPSHSVEVTDPQTAQEDSLPASLKDSSGTPAWLADLPPPDEDPSLSPGPLMAEGGIEFSVPRFISAGSNLLAGIQDPLPVGDWIAQSPSRAMAKSSSTENSFQDAGASHARILDAARHFSEIVTLPAGTVPEIGAQLVQSPERANDRTTSTTPCDPIESILAIDCGSTLTRAFLIGLVEDEFRLIAWAKAPSSFQPPWSDMAISARQALGQMVSMTGVRILDDLGQIISPEGQGGGVDAVVLTTSASGPLRLLLAAPTHKAPVESARRALSLSYAVIEGLVIADGRTGNVLAEDIESQVRLVQELIPDAIVVIGGEAGTGCEPILRSVEAMTVACNALRAPAGCPPIIYAGNRSLQQEVSRIVGDATRLQVVEDVRPSAEMENLGPLRAVVKDLHDQHTTKYLPGYRSMAAWSSAQMLPTAGALAFTVQYLAQYSRARLAQPDKDLANILAVDVGGATTAVATMVDRLPDLFICGELGTSHQAARILDHVPLESLLGWLPFHLDATEARNALYNKELHPHTLPQTRQDLFLEQAIAREILGWTMTACAQERANGPAPHPGSTPQFDLIIGAGGVLGSAPHPGLAALILLDGLQPVGMSSLALDRLGLAAAVGAVAAVSPLAALQVLERDALLRLGTVVAPMGTAREGKVALTVKIEYKDGRAMEARVPFGSLKVLPLPAGHRAILEIRPTNRFALGMGARGQAVTKEVEGGALGVIIDARGRPLLRTKDPGEQQARMQRWLSDIGSQTF